MRRSGYIICLLCFIVTGLLANGKSSSYSQITKKKPTLLEAGSNSLIPITYNPLGNYLLKTDGNYSKFNDDYLASLNTVSKSFNPDIVQLEKKVLGETKLVFAKIYLSGADQYQRMELKKFSNSYYPMSYELTSEHIFDFFTNTQYGGQFLNGLQVWGGIGFGMMGVLMIMPKSVTRWQDDYIQRAKSNLSRAFSEPPVWDEDKWQINYIGHPVAGAFYYNTIRAQGASPFQSFLFGAFISTGWEYLYEGVAEQPSVQDLIVTPVVGSLLGELTHQVTVRMKRNGTNFFEKIAITIINPMHVIMKGY